MAYFLTITRGEDEGRSFRIDTGDTVIGRSPSNPIVLHDESVAWEHALVREDNGRLMIRNLSALGTHARGRRVAGEVHLHDGDEIGLSEQCTLTVRQRHDAAGGRGSGPLVLVASVALAIVVVVVGGVLLLGSSEPVQRPVTDGHWRQGYHRLEDRLAEWRHKGWFPAEAEALFRDGWRLEHSGDVAAAAGRWAQLRSLLLAIPVPGGTEGLTMAEAAGSTSKTMQVLMGYDLRTGNNDYQWNTDEAYADALVWFVRYRARSTNNKAENQ